MTLAYKDVARNEAGTSVVQRFEQLQTEQAARTAAGEPEASGLMVLADFCRDHEMRAREQALLTRVIELQPDHAQARARLGYVASDAGWLTHDQHMQAQGLVKDGSEYITKDEQRRRERQRERAQRRQAKDKQAQAELKIESEKLQLERQRLQIEREQAAAAQQAAERRAAQPAVPYVVLGGRHGHHHHDHVAPRPCRSESCRRKRARRAEPFPIPGVRDPRDTSWPIAGVKDPRGDR